MNRPAEVWKFLPHPLIRNAHLQTALALHLPHTVRPYCAKQHRVALDDGDVLVMHEDAPARATETTPSVLMIHGLTGSHQSRYMERMADKLTAHGFRAFRADMRGCGAGEGLARVPAHCGLYSDVAACIHTIAELYGDSPVSVVGYSLGGTLVLNMLAEAGEMRVGNLEKSLVVCPPIDLFACERNFRTFFGSQYDKFFVKQIWKQVLTRWTRFPDIAPSTVPRRPPKLRDIDHLVIAPAGGFSSAEHYYAATQPAPKLASIRQPVTIVFSQDDPVVPCGPLFEFPHSDCVETILTKHGGHLGFLGTRNVDRDFRWLDWRILEWLEHPGQPPARADYASHSQLVK